MESNNYNTFDSPFATRLRYLMDSNNVKQLTLSNELKITRQAISHYMNGKVQPNAEKIVEIANYFNVSTDYLLGISETPTTNTNLKSACEYLGINESAINSIRKISGLNQPKTFDEVYKGIYDASYIETHDDNFNKSQLKHINNDALREYEIYKKDIESNKEFYKFNAISLSNFLSDIDFILVLGIITNLNIVKNGKFMIEQIACNLKTSDQYLPVDIEDYIFCANDEIKYHNYKTEKIISNIMDNVTGRIFFDSEDIYKIEKVSTPEDLTDIMKYFSVKYSERVSSDLMRFYKYSNEVGDLFSKRYAWHEDE